MDGHRYAMSKVGKWSEGAILSILVRSVTALLQAKESIVSRLCQSYQ